MKVLLVGVGTVGEAIARLSAGRPWLEQMVLAGHDLDRVRRVADSIGDATSHPVAHLDASDAGAVEALARAHKVDLVMNAVDPRFLMPVFTARLPRTWTTWTWRSACPHPTRPTLRAARGQARRRAVRDGRRMARPRPTRARGAGNQPGAGPGVRGARIQAPVRRDPRHQHPRGGRPADRGLPVRHRVLHLDDDRGVLNPPIVWEKKSGYFSLPPFSEPSGSSSRRASAPSSACTWSTRTSR